MAQIDLDQHDAGVVRSPVSVAGRVRVWAAALGTGATVAIVSALVGWVAAGAGPVAAPQQPITRAITLQVEGEGARPVTAIHYVDGRAEGMVPVGEKLRLAGVAVAAISVSSGASGTVGCSIVVDDQIVDASSASNGGLAMCIWPAQAAEPS